MTILQGVIFIEVDINTRAITFLRTDTVNDYDKNTTNIYVQAIYRNSDGDKTYLSSEDIKNYVFTLYTLKPGTNNPSTINGVVTTELKEQVRGGVVKFVIPKSCTNRAGVVKCELHVTKKAERIASTRFIFNVEKSLVTTFDEQLLDDEDFPVLQQLILEIQKASNIDDYHRSKITTYSSDKINSQFASKDEIFTMANMGQDIKEAMTGGSVAVVGKNTILTENIIDGQVTIQKTNFINEGVNIFNKNNVRVETGYYNAEGYNNDANYKTIFVKVRGNSTISISKVFGYLTEVNSEDTTTKLHVGLGENTAGYTFTTNENTTLLKITLAKGWSLDDYMVVYSETLPSEYVKYEPVLDSSINVPYALRKDLSNLEREISADNVDFINVSKNKFDKNNVEKGVYYRNGSDIAYDSVYSTISFKCKPNKQYTSSKAFGYITFWKKGVYVSNITGIGDATNYTFSTVECDEVKITIKTSENLNNFMVVEGSEMPSQYEEYGCSFNIPINGLQEDDKNIYLIGWFGQSNADGRGTNTKPGNISNDVLLIKDDGSGGVNVTQGNNINDNASAIPYFTKWLNILSNKKIAIAKWSLGGTSLIPSDSPSWNPITTGTNYYNNAKTLYQNSITYLEGLGYNVIKVGFVWTQGENEAEHGTQHKETYKSVLKSLISSFRNDLGVTDFKCFINLVGRKNIPEDVSVDKFQYIRQSQQEVADEDKNVFVISDCAKHFIDSEMGYMKDDLHYNDKGYILMGKQGAEYTYINIFNETHNAKYRLKSDREYI